MLILNIIYLYITDVIVFATHCKKITDSIMYFILEFEAVCFIVFYLYILFFGCFGSSQC